MAGEAESQRPENYGDQERYEEDSAEAKPWTAREHAVRAGELAAAIQPAEERFQAALDDPMERTKAIAMGAIKAHKAAIDHTLRVAELHARVADVLLRTDTVGVSHDEAVRRAAEVLATRVPLCDHLQLAKTVVGAIFPLAEIRMRGSSCCGAPMTVRSDAGEGMSMSYGVCTACGRPADGHA